MQFVGRETLHAVGGDGGGAPCLHATQVAYPGSGVHSPPSGLLRMFK